MSEIRAYASKHRIKRENFLAFDGSWHPTAFQTIADCTENYCEADRHYVLDTLANAQDQLEWDCAAALFYW
jgi:hypothetical protein